MRYNPFKPNSIVPPGSFTGRVEEITTIQNCLYQARYENPQHFLLEGERGIGKSSLVNLVGSMGRGEVVLTESMNFIVVSIDAGGIHSQLDLIRRIGRDIKSQIAMSEPIKAKAGMVWEFLSKWEVLGVRYHKDDNADPDDAREALVDQVATLMEVTKGDRDGLLILIDEADAAPVEAHLGEFLKSVSERLAKRGCNNVIFGLAGLPVTIARLRTSHESSPRMFSTMRLEPLSHDECVGIIKKALAEAVDKNGFAVTIADDALQLLANMSEGYPHFVQQFGFSAYDADTDNVISLDDVIRGAHDENGAIAQLGSKYFDQLYYSKISSEEYRKVLVAMAAHGDQWVQRRDLAAACKIKDSTFNNALAALKSRSIILADETRQGFYRLPTRSFAAWINAVNSVEKKGGGGEIPLSVGD